ncbi:MAG: DUF3352 domain-containing protein [Anaerolineae bacterium]|nr:DUF3352 domain-containing protein [Anaerolineae bacterium]
MTKTKHLILLLAIAAWSISGALPAPVQAQNDIDAGAAALLPPNADVYAWLNMADLEKNVRQVIDTGRQAGVTETYTELVLDGLLNAPFAGTGIDYRRDVAPWLGDEVALAVRGYTETLATPGLTSPEVAVIAASTDPSAALAFIQTILRDSKQSGQPLTEGSYDGVPVYYQNDIGLTLAGDHLVLGTRDLVHHIIGAYNGGPSLAGTVGFQKIAANLPPDSAVGVYLNAQDVAWSADYLHRLIRDAIIRSSGSPATPDPDGPMAPATAQFGEMVTGLAFSARVEAGAMMLDATVAVDAEAVRRTLGADGFLFRTEAMSGRIFQALPSDTFVMLAGRDLPDIFHTAQGAFAALEPVAETLNHYLVYKQHYQGPAPTGILQVVERWPVWFARLTGLDFEKDVMAWMSAEYAAALVPMAPGALAGHTSRFPFDLLAVAEIGDPAAAQRTAEAIPAALVDLGLGDEGNLSSSTVNGVEVYSLRLAQHHRASVSWAMTDGFAAAGTGTFNVVRFVDMMRSGYLPSMLDNARLQKALDRLGGPGHTLLFVDVSQGMYYLNYSLPETMRPYTWDIGVQRILYALESLTLSGRAVESDVYQLTAMAVFKE